MKRTNKVSTGLNQVRYFNQHKNSSGLHNLLYTKHQTSQCLEDLLDASAINTRKATANLPTKITSTPNSSTRKQCHQTNHVQFLQPPALIVHMQKSAQCSAACCVITVHYYPGWHQVIPSNHPPFTDRHMSYLIPNYREGVVVQAGVPYSLRGIKLYNPDLQLLHHLHSVQRE